MTSKEISRCYHCGGSTVTEVLGPLSGEDAPFALTLFGLPVRICGKGHRQFVHSKLALQRLLRLAEEGDAALPIGTETGRLFKRAACVDCGAKLDRSARRETFHLEMRLTESAVFGVDLTTRVYCCRRCRRTQLVRQELRERAPAAMVDALRSAGIGGA